MHIVNYCIPTIAVPIIFLIRWTISVRLYRVCQILVFNAIKTTATDMEGKIKIERVPLGHGMDQ